MELLKNTLLGLMLFLAFGPFIGGVVFTLMNLFFLLIIRADDGLLFAKTAGFFILMAYPVAVIPAAIAGAVAGAASPFLTKRANHLLMGVASSLISVAYLYFIGQELTSSFALYVFAFPSFAAGGILSWVLWRLTRQGN